MNIIELITAAGLASTIVLAGTAGYEQVSDSANVNTQLHAIASLDDAIQSAYRGQSLDSLSPSVVAMLAQDIPLRNAWGGAITAEPLTYNDPLGSGYRLIDIVPSRICSTYVARLARGWERAEVNGDIVAVRGDIDAAALSAACGHGDDTVRIGLVRRA